VRGDVGWVVPAQRAALGRGVTEDVVAGRYERDVVTSADAPRGAHVIEVAADIDDAAAVVLDDLATGAEWRREVAFEVKRRLVAADVDRDVEGLPAGRVVAG